MDDETERLRRAAAITRAAFQEPARTIEELLADDRLFGDDPAQDLARILGILLSERCIPDRARPAAERAKHDPSVSHAVACAVALERAAAAELDPVEGQRIQGLADRVRAGAGLLGDPLSCVITSHRGGRLARAAWDSPDHARALCVGHVEFALRAERGPRISHPRAKVRLLAAEEAFAAAAIVLSRPAGPVRDDTGLDPRDPNHLDFGPLDFGEEDPGPPPDTLLALARLGAGLKPDALREFKAAVGAIVGKRLPLTTVPASWAGFVAALDAEFPQFSAVTRAIVRLQGGRRTWGGLRVILTGPPGAGKTRYVRRLCELAGLHLARIPCDASADNSAVAATPRRWQTGHPCRAVAEMVAGMVANPVLLLDELGRASGSQQSNGGRLYDALIGQTDPENAAHYHDQFVEAQVDLSQVLWIATANDVAAVPSALLDRFVRLQCPLPGPEHLRTLAPQVARDACRQRGLDEGWASLDETDLALLSQHWRGGSLRRLARLVDVLIAARLDPSSAPRH